MFRNVVIGAVSAIFLLAGCAEIPKTELTSYTKAFGDAKQATEQVMLDLSASKQKIDDYKKKQQKIAAKPALPGTIAAGPYVPRVKRVTLAKADAITARLSALEVVDSYNAVLVRLASGEGIEKVKASAGGLVSAASRLVSAAGASIPGLSAAAGLIKEAAGAAEKYRERKEFARLVEKGGPQVRAILRFLIDDTVQIVDVHEGLWVAEMAPLRLKASNNIREIIGLVRNKHTTPTVAAQVAKAKKIADRIKAASGQDFTFPWSNNPALPPPDAAVFRAIDIKLAAVEADYRALTEFAERSPALRKVMDRYTDLLSAADTAMSELEVALSRPVDVSAAITDLLDTALSLKREYAAFRAKL